MSIEIRQLTSHAEFAEAVRLQKEIWGFRDVELLPVRLFVVASKIGGQAIGAFDHSKMVAFCLCIPGLKPGGIAYLHSHMLGVLPEYRNTGLGRTMKWQQREFGLRQGIDLIEWTFDPLEVKNAFFNIERLGAVVRRYVHNQYGTTTSHLHGGLPTDRLIAEWWIRTGRVRSLAEQRPADTPAGIRESISVPQEIANLKQHDRTRARQVQSDVAAQFDRYFKTGLTVVRFEITEDAGTYLLAEWASK